MRTGAITWPPGSSLTPSSRKRPLQRGIWARTGLLADRRGSPGAACPDPMTFARLSPRMGPQAAQVGPCGAQGNRPEAMPKNAVFGLRMAWKTA